MCGWLLEAAAILGLLLTAGPVVGQETRHVTEGVPSGSIHGTVTTLQENIPSGLAGVILKLTPGPDGSPLTAGTDEAGSYEFKGLKRGTYTISINQPGFKPYTKTVTVNRGQAAALDIRAELETVTEKVEVSEDTQSIATESATTPSVTLTQRQLISLPTAQEKIREATESVDNFAKAKSELEPLGMTVVEAKVDEFRKVAQQKIWPAYKSQYGALWDEIEGFKA